MPPIVDVTDILIDTDVAGQEFVVIRRQETVNANGESVWTSHKIPAVGSIQPSGAQDLLREDGFDSQAQSIKVVTMFRLFGVTRGPGVVRFKPDIIVWANVYYEITSPNDWSAFGAGFIEADATSIQYVEPGPPAAIPGPT
jgi:hypothetical protein